MGRGSRTAEPLALTPRQPCPGLPATRDGELPAEAVWTQRLVTTCSLAPPSLTQGAAREGPSGRWAPQAVEASRPLP